MKRQQSAKVVLFCTGALVLASLCAVSARAEDLAGVKPVQLPGVSNGTQSATDKVFFAGQPSKETLEALSKQGVKVVVNLRRQEEMTKVPMDEKAVAEGLGMKYINVPMSTSLPKDDQLKLVLDALADSQKNPVFLHCASSIRAGAIWATYLGLRKGATPDAAIAQGKAAGLNNEGLEHIVRNRIEASAKK